MVSHLQDFQHCFVLLFSALTNEDCNLELAFLLDSSESAKDNHGQEKRFVSEVVERMQNLHLQSGRRLSFRSALLQYSSHVISEQTFSQWRGVANFKANIAPIPYIGQGTYVTYAITNLTRLYLTESGPGSVRVAVLLYDGESHPKNPDLFSAVADAKNQGVRFFAIGVTPAARDTSKMTQLRMLASSPPTRYLHNLQDKDIVKRVIKELVSPRVFSHTRQYKFILEIMKFANDNNFIFIKDRYIIIFYPFLVIVLKDIKLQRLDTVSVTNH